MMKTKSLVFLATVLFSIFTELRAQAAYNGSAEIIPFAENRNSTRSNGDKCCPDILSIHIGGNTSQVIARKPFSPLKSVSDYSVQIYDINGKQIPYKDWKLSFDDEKNIAHIMIESLLKSYKTMRVDLIYGKTSLSYWIGNFNPKSSAQQFNCVSVER